MSIRDDFDELVAARLRATAPQEAPVHLMDSIIDRVAATPQRRRGPFAWLGSPVTRLAVAAAVLAVAVIAGTQFGGLFDRQTGTEPSPSASESADPLATATATLAPSADGAPSSSPVPSASDVGTADELVLRLFSVCDTGPGPQAFPRMQLMADGRVIWYSLAESPSQITTRVLTADGLAEMRDVIFSSGYLDESATYEPVRRPGTPDPPGHGVCTHTWTADDGAVIVLSTSWFGEPEESTYYEPAPERQELSRLASALPDPESLVAEDAWTGPASAYEGTEYQLLLHPVRDSDVPDTGSPDASEVPWPFDGPLDEFGETPRDGAFRCGNISRDEAMAIVEALNAPEGPHPAPNAPPYYFSVEWAEGNGWAEVYMVPLMPDGYPDCAGPL